MHPSSLVDYPAFVACAALFASNCTREMGMDQQAFVMRTLPRVLVDRFIGHHEAGFVPVMPALPGRRRPQYERKGMPALKTSPVADKALRKAIADRDEEILHSMVMHELTVAGQRVTGSAGDMLPTILRDRFKIFDETDALVHTWLGTTDFAIGRLSRMTWPQARQAAKAWEKDGEAQNQLRVPSLDGWHWRRLYSVRSLEREGLALAHCLGNGYYDDKAQVPVEEGGFWSLRNAAEESVMTLRLGYGGKGILEIDDLLGLCNRNAGVDDITHLPALRAYYAGLGVDLVPEMVTVDEILNEETVEVDGHEVEAWDFVSHDETGAVRTEHHTRDRTEQRERLRRDMEAMRARVEEANRQRSDGFTLACGPAFFRALRDNEAVRDRAEAARRQRFLFERNGRPRYVGAEDAQRYLAHHMERWRNFVGLPTIPIEIAEWLTAPREPDAVVQAHFADEWLRMPWDGAQIQLRSAPTDGAFRSASAIPGSMAEADPVMVTFERPAEGWNFGHGPQALVPDNVAYLVPELPDGQLYNATFTWTADPVERPPTRAERAAGRPHWQQLNERHQRRVR